MAIDFNQVKLNSQANNGASAAKADRPKAQFWLNVGYSVDVEVTDTSGAKSTESRFVAIPAGIPLDSVEPVAANSSNREFAALQAAKNNLLAQIMEVANAMKPGDEHLLKLEIQLRRINEPITESVPADANPLIKKFSLV